MDLYFREGKFRLLPFHPEGWYLLNLNAITYNPSAHDILSYMYLLDRNPTEEFEGIVWRDRYGKLTGYCRVGAHPIIPSRLYYREVSGYRVNNFDMGYMLGKYALGWDRYDLDAVRRDMGPTPTSDQLRQVNWKSLRVNPDVIVEDPTHIRSRRNMMIRVGSSIIITKSFILHPGTRYEVAAELESIDASVL